MAKSAGCGILASRTLFSMVILALATLIPSRGSDLISLPCDIHLTISSLEEKYGNLELNWMSDCEEMPDWIALYDRDPNTTNNLRPLLKIDPMKITDDFLITDITPLISFPGGWNKTQPEIIYSTPGPHCLDYWIASIINGTVNATNCLKIQPTWMSDIRDKIGNIPLSEMMLPGTHDTGSFNGPDSTVKGEGLKNFIFTQNQDVWNQLVYGIRYLDLRIGYYVKEESTEDIVEGDNSNEYDEESFWINHDLIRVRHLVPVLRDIKRFAEKAKNEIIIVDVHRLPVGFYLVNGAIRYKRHKELISLLFKELGDFAVDYSTMNKVISRKNMYLLDGPRMMDIWETGKRIIVCYPEDNFTNGSWMWPRLTQKWGNKQSVSSLEEYIESVIAADHPTRGNPLWAVMAQMTPRAFDIIFNPKFDLMQMANSVNRNLTRWVRDGWWKNINIMATDYFLGNNLIDLSIEVALRKKTTSNLET